MARSSSPAARRQNPPALQDVVLLDTAAGMRLFSALQETNPPPWPQECDFFQPCKRRIHRHGRRGGVVQVAQHCSRILFFCGKTPSAFAAGAPSKGGYLLTNVNGKLSFLSLIIFRAGQQLANGISGTQANKGGGERRRKKTGRRAAGRKNGTMINSFGTGKPTEFFLFLFSSLLPITPNSKCYRSQAFIEHGLLTTLVPRYKS